MEGGSADLGPCLFIFRRYLHNILAEFKNLFSYYIYYMFFLFIFSFGYSLFTFVNQF